MRAIAAPARSAALSIAEAETSTDFAVAFHSASYAFRPLNALSASRTSLVTSVRSVATRRG